MRDIQAILREVAMNATPEIPGYEIVRPIGRGGMGTVYLGRQKALGRLVAIKVLDRGAERDQSKAERIARFRREAELMAQVNHPNIVTIHDSGEVNGDLYLVMEYIEDGDLRSRMTPGQPMAVAKVRALLGPVCEALASLHKHGILHRDLKPENILMHNATNPKVADFGIAVVSAGIGNLTGTAIGLGTIGYVAPEQQYAYKKVDERADQYSLAALAYELLTGQIPLGIIQSPSRLNPRLRPEVDVVLTRALEDDPTDRFATIRDFGAALDQALAPRCSRLSRWPGLAVLLIGELAVVALLKFWPAPRVPVPVTPSVPVPVGETDFDAKPLVLVLDMPMVKIPAGEFDMGSDLQESEGPVHRVRISRPFYISKYEVSVGQFRKFVDAKGYETDAETSRKGGFVWDFEKKAGGRDPKANWRNPGYPEPPHDDFPVTQVSYKDALAFCEWLAEVEGRPYRLPTEAEWEYACRAASNTKWAMGNDEAKLAPYAWYTRTQAGESPHQVGTTPKPNAFGLHDMHGNAAEWCRDWFGPYTEGLQVNPRGPELGTRRVVRGGSWNNNADVARSATRREHLPDTPHIAVGFRICLPSTPKP